MSKHTPGPWSMGKNGRIEAINGLGKTIVIDELAIGDPANARLIAAAPELLEALKDAQKLLTGIYAAQFMFNPDDAESVKRAQAVWLNSPRGRDFAQLIAKATGKHNDIQFQ